MKWPFPHSFSLKLVYAFSLLFLFVSFYVSYDFFQKKKKVRGESSLPAQFDLSEKGLVNSPRKQSWGTCWAFSTILSMESSLLKSGVWRENEGRKPVDLSEYHLDKYNGFNRHGRQGEKNATWYSGQGVGFLGSNIDHQNVGVVVHLGGDFQMATAYLTNQKGAVQEFLTPTISHSHQDHQKFGLTPYDGILLNNHYSYYIPQHVEWLSFDRSEKDRRNLIKKYIMKYGAVASAQRMEKKPVAYAPDGKEIHIYQGNEKLNHALNIIGWDDDISWKEHRGAWLVQDSDHKDESKNNEHIGKFYVLYDDQYVGKDSLMGAVSFRDVIKNPFDHIYSHSLHGWRYGTDENFSAVANRFVAKSDEHLGAIGFYTLKKSTRYRIYLLNALPKVSVSSEKNIFSQKFLVAKGIVDLPGFHLVNSLREVVLPKGKEFYVVLQLDRGGYAYDASFTMEVLLGNLPPEGTPMDVYSKANKNESFYLNKNGKWKDFRNYYSLKNKQQENKHARNNPTANITLNAYTISLEKQRLNDLDHSK